MARRSDSAQSLESDGVSRISRRHGRKPALFARRAFS